VTVEQLLKDGAPLERIAAHLDGLGPGERVDQLSRLGRGEQRALYERAGDGAPLEVGFLVPAGALPGVSVDHAGTNTLPLPRFLRQFDKRFSRSAGGGEQVFGYNEWLLRRLLGPGYFVAESTAGRPDWEARGGVVVDYFRVPDGPVPGGWPKVVPNSRGLQRFVFNGTRDFLRRVSAEVSIGAAFKGEKPLDHFFTLCRRPG
jgi:hypothetical protein